MGCLPICSECGKEFYPYRRRMYKIEQFTCASRDCQRKRKSRLQKQRRTKQRIPGIVEALYLKQREGFCAGVMEVCCERTMLHAEGAD